MATLESEEIFMKNAKVSFQCVFPMTVAISDLLVVQNPKNELTPYEGPGSIDDKL